MASISDHLDVKADPDEAYAFLAGLCENWSDRKLGGRLKILKNDKRERKLLLKGLRGGGVAGDKIEIAVQPETGGARVSITARKVISFDVWADPESWIKTIFSHLQKKFELL